MTFFDYWFNQFDFPDIYGNPYRTSGGKMLWNKDLNREIPYNWNSTTIGDITICHDSKRVPLSSNERLLMQGDIPYYGATGIMDYVNKSIFDANYILLAEDGSVMDKSGHPILQRISGKCWINNHAHVLEPIEGYTCYLLFMLLKDIPIIQIKTGSIQMKINQENLNQYKVIDIPESIRNKAANIINPIDAAMISIQRENNELIRLRDWLLPMLMNGQATIED